MKTIIDLAKANPDKSGYPYKTLPELESLFQHREKTNGSAASFIKKQKYASRVLDVLKRHPDSFCFAHESGIGSSEVLMTSVKIYGGGLRKFTEVMISKGLYVSLSGTHHGKKLMGHRCLLIDDCKWYYTYNCQIWEKRNPHMPRIIDFNPDFEAMFAILPEDQQQYLTQKISSEICLDNTICHNIPDYLANYLILR